MAAPINSIAATFSTINAPKPSLTPSASLSWNPHSPLSCSHKSSLLDLYGSPAPLPLRPISAVRSPRLRRIQSLRSCDLSPITASVGAKLPNSVPLSYLDKNGGIVRSVSLGGLLKGKRRAVVVGVSAAFSPGCDRFVRRVESAGALKSADLIACVAPNDAFVMGAWGEHLALGRGNWKMLSDGGGELCKEFGISSMRNFWVSASNGIVTHVSLDGDAENDGDNESQTFDSHF